MKRADVTQWLDRPEAHLEEIRAELGRIDDTEALSRWEDRFDELLADAEEAEVKAFDRAVQRRGWKLWRAVERLMTARIEEIEPEPEDEIEEDES